MLAERQLGDIRGKPVEGRRASAARDAPEPRRGLAEGTCSRNDVVSVLHSMATPSNVAVADVGACHVQPAKAGTPASTASARDGRAL